MSRVSPSTTSFEIMITFKAALEAYNTQTQKDIASHPLVFQLSCCGSPSAILDVLRAQVQVFNQSHRDEKLTTWLAPTVNVLHAFSATLGNVVGLVFPPANAIFAGIGVLLQTINDAHASQDTLIELFGRIEYFFKRLEAYMEIRPTAAMTDIMVKIMIEVLSILGIITKEIKQGRMKKYLKMLVGWTDVENSLQRLDRLTQEEAHIAAAEALKIACEIDNEMEVMDSKVEDVDESVQAVRTRVEDIGKTLQCVNEEVQGVNNKINAVIKSGKETKMAIQQAENRVNDINRNALRKELRKCISAPDPSVNFVTACDAHHEGTAAWCTRSITFADWKESGSLLWIHGKPGSGKSVLSSVIIRDIKTTSGTGGLGYVAYFYFDFKNTAKQGVRALLSSLIVQLSDQSDHFSDVLLELYSEHQEGSEQPSSASLARSLKKMFAAAGQVPVYLVVDALDECPDNIGVPSSREKALDLVEELVKLRHPNLRLCVTSRLEFDIRTVLEPLATQQLSLHDESGQKQDIIDYVTSFVRSDRKMSRWPDEEKDMVIEKLTENADGMFQWVFCQLEILRHCFSADVRRVLEELPRSLDETYERILKGINKANRQYAQQLLRCLTVAARPLRVEELAEMLEIEANPDLNLEDQEEAMLSACSSLVSVINDDGSRIVQFSHFSVKEFLISDRLAKSLGEVSMFHISLDLAHTIVVQACLNALACLGDRSDEDNAKCCPLIQYASEFWVNHAQFEGVEPRISGAMEFVFDMDRPYFLAWLRMEILRRRYPSGSEMPTTTLPAAPLYVAACHGFRGLLERLIVKHPHHVNACGGPLSTSLHASVLSGHAGISRLLLTHGADINAHCQCASSRTPLHFASERGLINAVNWLLDNGADLEHPGIDGRTPLNLAASSGHSEVARILLNHGAGLNAPDDEGCTPLYRALEEGEFDIVQLLLDRNANVHVRDNRGNTLLHLAAAYGTLDIAQMLLEHDLDVNARDDEGSTPLQRASEEGELDVLRLLLDSGADVHVRGDRGKTLLHSAAVNGQPEVAKILLELNVEVDARKDDGATPLHLASEGELDVVRLLLDRNADVNARDNTGNTPLHIAAYNRRSEVVQVLLERNAVANALNNHGYTPIQIALNEGELDVVQLLLNQCAGAVICRDACEDVEMAEV